MMLQGMPFGEQNTPNGIYTTCFETFSRDSRDESSLSRLAFTAEFIGETNPSPCVII
jgi:hypothetical protein